MNKNEQNIDLRIEILNRDIIGNEFWEGNK